MSMGTDRRRSGEGPEYRDLWVPASAMRNHVMAETLLDWLDLHGQAAGFSPDPADVRTDFDLFVMRKGREFECAVLDHLGGLDIGEVRRVADGRPPGGDLRGVEAVTSTVRAMRDRVAAIVGGALRHDESRTFGAPDLLVRSDILMEIFPEALTPAAAAAPAPLLGLDDCHYAVVDVKFTTLRLLTGGGLNDSRSNPAYKVQLFVYNRALGALQGHLPPRAFLLGRGWEQRVGGHTTRVANCMDRLAAVDNAGSTAGAPLAEQADAAAAWLRRVRREGRHWTVLPEPSVPELRPNANGEAGRWKSAVKAIVAETEDLTRLWGVGAAQRDSANAKGLTRWSDPAVTAEAIGAKGTMTGPRLQALLDVNRGVGPDVQPQRLSTERTGWHEPAALEFFVDFETVSDLDDDFADFPARGGQPLIFMIGCGHIEDGQWRFRCFTAEDISEASEATILDDWFDHMAHVGRRLGDDLPPRVYHWARHEVASLREATARHPGGATRWPEPEWFDLLSQVMKPEPVVVRGAHSFGLKEVTNALSALGHLDISWETSLTDGRGAMVGAWWCQRHLDMGAAERLADFDLMRETEAYNEVDCKAIMDIIGHLRRNHLPPDAAVNATSLTF